MTYQGPYPHITKGMKRPINAVASAIPHKQVEALDNFIQVYKNYSRRCHLRRAKRPINASSKNHLRHWRKVAWTFIEDFIVRRRLRNYIIRSTVQSARDVRNYKACILQDNDEPLSIHRLPHPILHAILSFLHPFHSLHKN